MGFIFLNSSSVIVEEFFIQKLNYMFMMNEYFSCVKTEVSLAHVRVIFFHFFFLISSSKNYGTPRGRRHSTVSSKNYGTPRGCRHSTSSSYDAEAMLTPRGIRAKNRSMRHSSSPGSADASPEASRGKRRSTRISMMYGFYGFISI